MDGPRVDWQVRRQFNREIIAIQSTPARVQLVPDAEDFGRTRELSSAYPAGSNRYTGHFAFH